MNDRNVNCFLALVRSKNVAETAQELSIQEQSVWRNIVKLEEELGVSLFLKGVGGVKLTYSGQCYYNYFAQLEDRLNKAAAYMNNPRGSESFYIAWSDWFGCPPWLEQGIHRYAEQNPQLLVHLRREDPSNIITTLMEREADVVFTSITDSYQVYEPHIITEMEDVPVYAIVEKSHPLAAEECATPRFSDVKHYFCGSYGEEEDDVMQRVQEVCTSLGYLARQMEILDNWDSVYLNVALGNGICFAPHNEDIKSIKAVKTIPIYKNVKLVACFLHNSKSSYTKDFVDFLLREKRV